MFTGCGTALVTPFRADGSLDEATLRALVQRQIDAGIDFLVPCGTTGESPTLSHEEHLRVVELTVELAKGKVPVLAGAGGYNTAEVISLARELAAIGADGILSVTPYYHKPTQEGLFQHYKAIASAISLPIILYSVQGRTGVNIEPATVKRLASIDNIVGIKEASGNISQIVSVLNAVPADFLVVSGDDAITLPVVALGGRGVISVAANEIPSEMRRLTRLATDNEISAARQLHRRYLPLMEINFVESNPIPVKSAMAEMGLLEPVWRLPLVPPKPENLARIRGVLEPVGALPVIIEDEVLLAGNSGVYEGTVVKCRAILGTGVILNRSTPVYDLVHDTVHTATASEPLIIPEDDVVVPGSRAITHSAGKTWGLSLQCAVIVKYRDSKTNSRVQLEDFLR